MCIRGDFTLYDAKASGWQLLFWQNPPIPHTEEIRHWCMNVVEETLQNIVRILLEDRFRKTKGYAYTDEINLLAEECFRFSKDGQDNPNHLIQARFQSDAVLVGVGCTDPCLSPGSSKTPWNHLFCSTGSRCHQRFGSRHR